MPIYQDELLEVGDWVWRDDHGAVGRIIVDGGHLLVNLYFTAARGGTGSDYTEHRADRLSRDTDYLITGEKAWQFREELARLADAKLPPGYAVLRFAAADYPGERWARSGLPLEVDWSTQGLFFSLVSRKIDDPRGVKILYRVVFGEDWPWW